MIREACARALPGIERAADGSEAAIYNLRFVIADLLAVLLRDGAIVDALAAKGIRVERESGPWVKHA